MNVSLIRKDFPILVNQKQPFVYLDNAATTQKPEAVIERLTQYYTYENSNIHRGSYALSNQASRMFEHARRTVQEWIGAPYAEEIVFTKGCTEAVNLVASAVFETWINEGDNVIVTELEHSSNYFPWKHQCEAGGAELRVAEANPDGSLEPEAVLSLIDKRTKMIAITAMSNVTGFCPDIKYIISIAHKNHIPVLVDAAQAIAHQTISVRELQCDFLCFSGHKVYGPMGIGVLYGRKKYLEELAPYLYGGDMVIKGDRGELTYKESAGKYEAGTQDIAGALGLEAALFYLQSQDFTMLQQYEAELGYYLRTRLEKISGIHTVGPVCRSPVVVFDSEIYGAYDIGVLLAGKGIAVRCGSHCVYPLMKRLGKESLCRISLSFFNTMEEIDYTAGIMEQILGR